MTVIFFAGSEEMGGVVASGVVPHTPRMGAVGGAPDFIRPLIDGARAMGEEIRALEPDLVVLNSTHWVSTFNWYATSQKVHDGYCVADEAPDMIPGTAYHRPGDPDFAAALIAAGRDRDLLFFANATEHFHWDYGSMVPLLFLDPDSTLPVVLLPTVIMAELDEALDVGRLVHATAQATGKNVVHLSSTALSHKLVRGPDKWPTEERREMDRRFVEKACAGEIADLIEELPGFARDGVVEMGGRTLATCLGALDALGDVPLEGRQFGGYAQSSGSGNVSVLVAPAA